MKNTLWKTLKKTICLCLAATLCMTSLSACGGLPNRSDSSPLGDDSIEDSSFSSSETSSSVESEDSSSMDSEDSSSNDSGEDSSSDSEEEEETPAISGTHYNIVAVSTHWGASNSEQITFKFSDTQDADKSAVDLGYEGWVLPDDSTKAFRQYIKVKGQSLSNDAVLQGMDKKNGLCLSNIGTLSVGDVITIEQGAKFTSGDVSFTTAYAFSFRWNGTTYTEEKSFKDGIAFTHSKTQLGVGRSADGVVQQQNATNVTYSSSHPNIATVDASTGRVTAKSLGVARITATAMVTGSNTPVESMYTVKVQPAQYTELKGQEECVRVLGRTFTDSRGVNCYTTASGIAVTFYGTQLKATITASGITLPRLCVLVDGETNATARTVDLTKTTTTAEYTLVSGLANGEHTVYVHKITEAYFSSLAIASLKTDGYLMDKPTEKKYQFEVYGDSITAGLHNMKTVGAADPTPLEADYMQNGCMTYAFKTAQNLGADINVMARSGVGMYSTWGTLNPLNTAEEMSMLNMWNRSYVSDVDRMNATYTNPEWNFSNYKPDLVIINIGTNDVWWANDRGVGFSAEVDIYKTALTTLCNNLFTKYGADLKIVLVSGMMITDNTPAMQQVQQSFALQGKAVIHVQLNKAANGHPNSAEHQTASELLTAEIRKAFGM